MPKVKDIAGIKFNRLTPISVVHSKYKGVYWECLCDCGKTKVVSQSNIIRGSVKSCGCARNRVENKMEDHPMYSRWKGMHQRCKDEKSIHYHMYGGRGIVVCERWSGKCGFWNFVEDMGVQPFSAASIDRIDTNGMYSPENCRWASPVQQGNNTRRNKIITIDGESKTMSEWCRHIGISVQTVAARINSGWSYKDAIMTTVKTQSKRRYLYKGVEHTISELAMVAGISIASICFRLKKLSVEDAVELPLATGMGGKWFDGRSI